MMMTKSNNTMQRAMEMPLAIFHIESAVNLERKKQIHRSEHGLARTKPTIKSPKDRKGTVN